MDKQVKQILLVDLLAMCLWVAAPILSKPPRDEEGFFAQPLPALISLSAAALFIAAGIFALIGLMHHPLIGRRGQIAQILSICFAVMLIVGTGVAAGLQASGYPIPEAAGQWLELFLIIWITVSVWLAVSSHSPGQRGWLILPVLLGVFTCAVVAGQSLSG